MMSVDDALVRVCRSFEARMRGREIHRLLHDELMDDLLASASALALDPARVLTEGRLEREPSRAGGRYPSAATMRKNGG